MKKRWMLCLALACLVVSCAGCGKDNSESASEFIEGDVIKEYSSDTESDMRADTSENIVADDSVGGLRRDLNIPENAETDLPVDGTSLKAIKIKASEISVPDKDKMYTKRFNMGGFDPEQRESLLKVLFDEESGIHNYEYDLKDDVTKEQVDQIFADNAGAVDYSQDYFVGKIDGKEYILYFYNSEWSTDEGFSMSPLFEGDIPKELADRGAVSIYTSEYPPMSYRDESDKPDESESEEEPNKCSMSADEAANRARDYMAEWGVDDTAVLSVADMYVEYDDDEGYAVDYEKNGYVVILNAAVNGVPIYQPRAFGVDTISGKSKAGDDYDSVNYYYTETSQYILSFDDSGIISVSCTWPMRSNGDIQDAGSLLSWDEVVENLKSVIPEHFQGYEGYSSVEFNNVRLAYFRICTGDGEYEVIPVYAFAQLEKDRDDDTYPIQLIMLDARDGKEISIMQDPSRLNAKK